MLTFSLKFKTWNSPHVWKGNNMDRLFIRTTKHSTYSYPLVESYTYDRDFVRIHYYSEIGTKKFIDVLPTSSIEVLTIYERGNNNA